MSAICTHPIVNQKSKPFSICIIFFLIVAPVCGCVCDENVLHLLSQLTSSMQYIFKLQSHYWIWNLQNQFILQVQICVPWHSSPGPLSWWPSFFPDTHNYIQPFKDSIYTWDNTACAFCVQLNSHRDVFKFIHIVANARFPSFCGW